MNRYTVKAFDGKEITVTEWKPDGEIKGLVQISHGMVEHALRYAEFASRLNEEGYLVFADDHRAHGETDKDTLGYSDGSIFENTLKDLYMLTEKYKAEYPDKKLVFFGHSYGSFLTQAYIQRYNLHDAVIIGGSAKMSKASARAGKAVASIGGAFKGLKAPSKMIKKMTFDAYNKKFKVGNFVSSIPAEVARYEGDPFCSFICSNNFYKNFMRGLLGLYTKKGLNGIDKDKPILLLAGEDDPVGSMGKAVKKLRDLYVKTGVKSVTLVLLPDTRHEYFNDVRREEAYAAAIGFIEENS